MTTMTTLGRLALVGWWWSLSSGLAPSASLARLGARGLPFGSGAGEGVGPGRRRQGGDVSMLFLMESPYKADALMWAKETSRTQRAPKCAVVALYDSSETCVYVGAFEDVAVAVASLCKKHGRETVHGLRQEEFPPEVFEDDEGRMMMKGLVRMWLQQATEDVGAAPIGNAQEDWDDFDKTQNPFLAGYLGAEGSGLAALLTEEELAEEKFQQRKENMKQKMDEAVAAGNEKLAILLLRRLGKLGEGSLLDDDDENIEERLMDSDEYRNFQPEE